MRHRAKFRGNRSNVCLLQ